MKKYLLLLLLSSVIACSKPTKLNSEYIFIESETIEYISFENQIVQLIKSSRSDGQKLITDSVIVIKTYKLGKVVEEKEYRVEQGDSTIQKEVSRKYDLNDNLVSESESVHGLYSNKSKYQYEDGKEVLVENLDILYHRDYSKPTLDIIGADTIRSTVYSYYDEKGRRFKTKGIIIEKLLDGVYESSTPDTSFSYHYFDKNGNNINTVTTRYRDTVSVYQAEFSDSNELLGVTIISDEFGTSSTRYEYDEKGNKSSEIFTIAGIPERTDFEYDAKNRVVNRLTYRAKEKSNNQWIDRRGIPRKGSYLTPEDVPSQAPRSSQGTKAASSLDS